MQEAQFTTLGGNVQAVAVEGTFDDCQRLAKQAFAQRRAPGARAPHVGQLDQPGTAPAADDVLRAGRHRVPGCSGPLTIVVPSGNFGNIAAGLMARRMGAPIAHLHAATTVNDTVPRYLATGVLEPRPSVSTLANAMDVGDPSNLERIQWMFGGDVAALRAAMSASVHADDEVRVGDSRAGSPLRLRRRSPHRHCLSRARSTCLASGDAPQVAVPRLPRIRRSSATSSKRRSAGRCRFPRRWPRPCAGPADRAHRA